MKILQVHNYYQIRGGEDSVVENEKSLLEKNGHEVITYYKHNNSIETNGVLNKYILFKSTIWSEATYKEITDLISETNPDICHIHNFLPIISPSVFQACKDSQVPVVQTLHNYRLMCTNGLLMRENEICEICIGNTPFKSVAKKCYRNSYSQTFTVARMMQKQDWNKLSDGFICFTEFAKSKFVEHGIRPEKIFIKPNHVQTPESEVETKSNQPPYLIFVGRLDKSKGLETIIEISPQLPITLKIVGDGPLKDRVSNLPNVEYLGKLPNSETQQLVRNAEALIFPSIWYEGMPMTILEAFANKTSVIASKLGAMESIITDQVNGLLFDHQSSTDLLNKVTFLLSNNKVNLAISNQAFESFKSYYSEDGCYQNLLNIYTKVSQ